MEFLLIVDYFKTQYTRVIVDTVNKSIFELRNSLSLAQPCTLTLDYLQCLPLLKSNPSK